MTFARSWVVTAVVGAALAACSGTTDDGGAGGAGGSGGKSGAGGNAGSSTGGTGATGGSSGGGGGAGGGGTGGTGSGGGGSGGSSGSGGAGAGGRGGGAGSGGTAGAGGSSDAGALCEERIEGALVDFDIVGESLTVWITNGEFIDEAKKLLASGDQRIPVFDGLLDGRDCDADWTWHVDPSSASFADFTIELCDGLPSHIEADKTYWIGTVKSYCPWSAKVTAVDDRR
jgi:hypothetical protein